MRNATSNAALAAAEYAALTPADHGIIAASLDHVSGLGDDEATDSLTNALRHEAGLSDGRPQRIAYHVIHAMKRRT